MKKLTLAVAVMSVLGAPAASAAVLSEGANGALVPLVEHDGNFDVGAGTGRSTVVGVNSCATGTVYWTFWDPDTKHVTDGRFKITTNETYSYIWSDPQNSGVGLENQVGYLTFILDTSVTASTSDSDGIPGALDVSDIPCLAANAFQVDLNVSDVVFQPTLPLDATLGDFGQPVDGLYTPFTSGDSVPLDELDELSIAGLSAGANGHDIIHLRYLIDPSGQNQSIIYVWSAQDMSGSYTVNMYRHDQHVKSVTLNFPNEELNWIRPEQILGRDPTHLDGVIRFNVPEVHGDQDDDGVSDQVRGVFSWTFVSGAAFGAVQTIINPIYLRDHDRNYGHRLRVVTGRNETSGPNQGAASAPIYEDYECDATPPNVDVLPWCDDEL
jgi:hypothetical protein